MTGQQSPPAAGTPRLSVGQTLAYAGADPAGFIELMADLAFPRTPVRDVASWRNKIRQSLKDIAAGVRANGLSPEAAADRIDRWSVGHSSSVTRRTSSIVATLDAAPATPDPVLLAEARRLLRQHAGGAKAAARARAAAPLPDPAPSAPCRPEPAAERGGQADLSGEVVGLDQSIAYTTGLAAFAGEHSPHGNEGYLARLSAARVTGDGLTTGRIMQDAFAAAEAAALAHAAELGKQTGVQEAFDQNPDAGDKAYLAGDTADTGQVPIGGRR